MADLLDLLPLFPEESEETVLSRMLLTANEALATDSPRRVDTREGSHLRTAVNGGAREIARVYDLMGTVVPAAASPLFAWGSYLDGWAVVLRVPRLIATYAIGEVRFDGDEDVEIIAGTTVAVMPVTQDEEAPTFQTTETVIIPVAGFAIAPVRAVEAGSAGNVSVGAISEMVTPLLGVTVTNLEPLSGGSDVETDEALRTRVLDEFVARGPGTAGDYRRWARQEPGVGRVTVLALWNGAGTVRVIVTDADGAPVSVETEASLQARLDPVAGKGAGTAPVGATVTVDTATTLAVDVAATVELETGYSLDPVGGMIAIREELREAVAGYINEGIGPGGEVVRAQVMARLAEVGGVHDVSLPTLNGVAANLAVSADPPKTPFLDDLTLTAGTLP